MRNNRNIIIFLTTVVLLLTIPAASAYAAESASVVDIEAVEYDMIVGQIEYYDLSDTKAVYSDGSKYNFYPDRDDTAITVSDEEVLKLKHKDGDDTFSIKAISPGSAALTISNSKCTAKIIITVADYGVAIIDRNFPKTGTVNKGSWLDFGSSMGDLLFAKINMGEDDEGEYLDEWQTLQEEDYKLSASNDKVTIGSGSVKGVKKGKVDITLTITAKSKSAPNLYGKSFTCRINVLEGSKASPTTVVTQTDMTETLYYDCIPIGVRAQDCDEYQIWYSKKKNSGYKKLSCVKSYAPWLDDKGIILFEPSVKLKPDTKYYFKVRTRYKDEYHSSNWSVFSKPKAYWTPMKPISNSKVKFNKKTHKVSWAKKKGAVGYVYTLHAFENLGYNVFGQSVVFSADQERITNKNTLKTPKKLYYTTVTGVENVKPIAKHGKYYYISGEYPVKKKSDFKSEIRTDKRAL